MILYCALVSGFERIYLKNLKYDWILKADDDTFVIIENLSKFLKDYDPQTPLFTGLELTTWETVCYVHKLLEKNYRTSFN